LVLAPRVGRGDSFLGAVDADVSDLGHDDFTLARTLTDQDAFHHLNIVGGYLGSTGAMGLVGYLRERLRRAPADRWRQLDLAIAESHAAGLRRDRPLARQAAARARAVVVGSDDPALMLVVAAVLADADYRERRGGDRLTDGKREVAALIVGACELNRRAPRRGVARAIAGFTTYAGLVPAYVGLLAGATSGCGG
jgi:hypothetical protein